MSESIKYTLPLTFEWSDLFLNTDTGEIDTFSNLTSWETDSETMLKMTDQELSQANAEACFYFVDMLNDGVYVKVEK